MSFLDNNGLSYFYSKLKQIFTRSVNSITPDAFGDVKITNVATADNLTSPDNQTSYGKYIYRTSGGDASLTSGPAELMYIEGNMSIVGRQEEQLSASATNGIIISINAPIWRVSTYGEESGTYTFNYTASSGTWSPSLNTYGLSATGIIDSSVSAFVDGSITDASVTKATWETQITTAGTYYFIYEENAWTLDGSSVTLSDYGIEVTGTPENGDTITVTYITATPDSVATVTYVKGELGTIYVAKPSAFSATGFNQCDPSSMVLEDMTISGGYIASASDSYVCYCRAVGGVTNGYVAYSVNGNINAIGWCEDIPQESSEVIIAGASVTSELASITFDNDGYVVVAVDNTSDICIHPKWSGAADTEYEEYVEPSIIVLPTTGIIDSRSVQLPLATYGMPAIGIVADKLDLEAGIYTQKIGHYTYSAENLAIVQALNVPYEYDANHIYYVLSNPIQYSVSVNPNYTVNDWGTEEFIGTTIAVSAQTLYAQNLRDKLRTGVELKKLQFNNVAVASSVFVSDSTYESYPYRGSVTLVNVIASMIPEVTLGVNDAVSGNFAPVAETYNGGIYLYAADIPEDTMTIPTVICWRGNEE